jgi:PAS domain S-box-containing protein
MDRKPRAIAPKELAILRKLADTAMRIVALRRHPGPAIFATAVNLASDPVAIADTSSAEPAILYVNRSFLAFAGCRYHEAIGKPFAYPCPPDVAGRLHAAVQQSHPMSVECDYEFQSVRRRENVTVIPYLSEHGTPVYSITLHRDLSASKEADAQLHQLHAMQTTLRSINHLVLNFLNAASLFRQTAEGRMEKLALSQFESAIENTRAQLAELASMQEFRERKTPFGFTLLDPKKRSRA